MNPGTTTTPPEGFPFGWPPSFPHADIDRLVELLESGGGDGEDAEQLLLTITREAQRLRSAVVRLSAARLSSAEQEAHTILTEAQTHADDIRRRAMRAVDDRLDEAEQLVRSMRRAFLVEHRIRGNSEHGPRPVVEDDFGGGLFGGAGGAGPDDAGADGVGGGPT